MSTPRSAATRGLVVETALRLFREEGYEATTMRRIASEAGLSPSNAYYYFSGKDELVQELDRQMSGVRQSVRSLAPPA